MNEYQYDNETVKGFIVSSIFWGVVGIVVGLWISIARHILLSED